MPIQKFRFKYEPPDYKQQIYKDEIRKLRELINKLQQKIIKLTNRFICDNCDINIFDNINKCHFCSYIFCDNCVYKNTIFCILCDNYSNNCNHNYKIIIKSCNQCYIKYSNPY